MSFKIELIRALDVLVSILVLMFATILTYEALIVYPVDGIFIRTDGIPITDVLLLGSCGTWFLIRSAVRWIQHEGRERYKKPSGLLD